MSSIRSYRDLEVWQTSMDVVEHCYALTSKLPRNEQFNLCDQIRRSAISIPANIAEGHRRTRKSYLHHLSIALGSHAELETYLEITQRIGLLNKQTLSDVRPALDSVGRLLHGLIRSLEQL
jgi:four helix bundle protein